MNPKVTIIIPCYNAERWIKESIESALAQTYHNTEVIFVDNESTDNSLRIAQDIQTEHTKLIISTAPNLYRYSWEEPVEEALRMSTGNYFTILGADDYLRNDYIESIVKIISSSDDKIKLLQSPITVVRGDKEEFMGQIGHSYQTQEQFKNLLFQKCSVNTPTVVYKKELHDKGIIRWNSKECLGAADYDLYFNIADHGLFIYPYPNWIGYYYRWHEGQSTWGMHKETTSYEQLIKERWYKRWFNE